MSAASDFSGVMTDDGLQLTVGPVLVRIRSEFPATAEHLARFYDGHPIKTCADAHLDMAVVGGRGLRRWLRPQANLVLNGGRPYLPLPATLAGPMVEWGINHYVGRYAHQWVVVHAAVVERDGTAIVMPAEPGAGKSTLCAALTFAGWRLLSDEFALVDPATGMLSPLPRPIALKNASIDVIGRRYPHVVFGPEGYDVDHARFVHAKATRESVERAEELATPRYIIFPRYAAEQPTTIERLPKAEALMKVADQSFNYNYLGVDGYRCLVDLVTRTDCYRLEYSDLDDVLGRLALLTRTAQAASHA